MCVLNFKLRQGGAKFHQNDKKTTETLWVPNFNRLLKN
jgi:hypothetical protein